MSESDLDQAYSALCESMARVGEQKAPLLLAMLCLSLISRQPGAAEVRRAIAQAEAGCLG